MKKAMILGAGAGQIPFMNICRQLGCYVIAVSPKGDYPGFDVADKSIYLNTTDKEGILKAAMEEGIDFITTDQTDVSVPSVAYVAEKMGLKGIGYDMSLKFTDKYLMRKAAKAIGIPVPDFFLAKTYEDIEKNIGRLRFPVIVKPTNSSGSRGVKRVDSPEDLKSAFENAVRFSTNREAVVERFICGIEYLADGFAMNGKYITTDFGIKEYFDIPGTYISKMCMFSSSLLAEKGVEKRLVETNSRLVKGLGLPFGITHAEYLYCPEDDTIYLVEVAARGGGVNLSSDITPEASGINTNFLLLDYLANDNEVDVETLNISRRVSAWRCFELVPGQVVSIEGADRLAEVPGIQKICLDHIKKGMTIGNLTDDTGKQGPILACGDNREECYKVFDRAKEILDIKTMDASGKLHGIKW